MLGTHCQVPVGPPSEVEEIFDAISYCKGSCVIRMLHEWIGQEVGIFTGRYLSHTHTHLVHTVHSLTHTYTYVYIPPIACSRHIHTCAHTHTRAHTHTLSLSLHC